MLHSLELFLSSERTFVLPLMLTLMSAYFQRKKPQAQTEMSDDTGTPPSPTPGVPSGPDTEATDSSATQEASSSAQSLMTSGIAGAATVAALLIWSLFD